MQTLLPTLTLALVCWLASAPLVAAEIDAAAAQGQQRIAAQAYRDEDLMGYTRALEAAVALNPNSLVTRYNLACGYARTGRPEQAMDMLRELAAVSADYGMADDEDLASLREREDFQQLVNDLKKGTQPVSTATHAFTLQQLGLIPEGIALHQPSGRFFIGSMRSGDIFVVDAEGQLSKFATVQHAGKMAAIGLMVDEKRGLLWAVGSTFSLVEDYDPEAEARSGVFGFDLSSGELREHYLGTNTINGFNDVALSPSGDIYLSGDAVSVVRKGSAEITPIDTSIKIFGSNGIAVRPDGKRMFVSSYPVGIASIDPASGAARWLDTPADVSLYGVDGLYWHKGFLIAVQNGMQPWRLVKLQLNADQTAVTAAHLIEFATEEVTPTTGAIRGDTIYYVGSGPSPENLPSQLPKSIAGFSGKTIVMSAPLN